MREQFLRYHETLNQPLVLKSLLKGTEHALRRTYGFVVDLEEPGRVNLVSEEHMLQTHIMNMKQKSALHSILSDRGIPLEDLIDQPGPFTLLHTAKGAQLFFSADYFSKFWVVPRTQQECKLLSMYSLVFFEQLSRAVINQTSQELFIGRDQKFLELLMENFDQTLREKAANHNRREDIVNFSKDLRQQLLKDNQVVVFAKGAQIILRSGPLELTNSTPDDLMAVLDILISHAEGKFVSFMQDKHHWFVISPKDLPSMRQKGTGNAEYDEVVNDTRESLSQDELLRNSQALFHLFHSSKFTRQYVEQVTYQLYSEEENNDLSTTPQPPDDQDDEPDILTHRATRRLAETPRTRRKGRRRLSEDDI